MPSQETEFEFSPSGVMRDEEFERAEINLQSLQRRWLSEIFIRLIKSDKETLFHSS